MGAGELFPNGRCWIGAAGQGTDRWEVSNGPAGGRSHADQFRSAREAVDHARRLGLTVTFEEDFEWGDDRRLFAWRMRGAGDVKLVRADDEEQAARVAIQARVEFCEMSRQDARLAVVRDDDISPADEEELTAEDPGAWDGRESVGHAVNRV